jgi:hypothetical protein
VGKYHKKDTMRIYNKMALKQPDKAGRINIGKEFLGKTFLMELQPDGNIVLSPVVVRHEREEWLYNNPEAMGMVRLGLEQSARGEGVSLGSFAQFATEEDDEGIEHLAVQP